MVTSGAMDVLFVLLALEVLQTGDSGAAILNAALGIGTIVGGAATFSLVGRQALAPVLAAAALLWGGSLVVVGAVAPIWLAAPLIAVGGMGYAACDVVGRTILQRVTPDRMLARVLGALEGINLAGLALGSIVVTFVVGLVGVQVALIAVGLLLPLGVGISWLGLRTMDRTTLVPTRALDLLRAVPLFEPLAPPQLECVVRRTRWLTLEPGEVLIREGDVGEGYYVLESGELSVTQGGRPLRTVAERGDGVGEIALLQDVPRTATVTAILPSVLLTLGRADFLEAVTGHPQAHDAARRVVAERLAARPRGLGRARPDGRRPGPRCRPGRSHSSHRAMSRQRRSTTRPSPGRRIPNGSAIQRRLARHPTGRRRSDRRSTGDRWRPARPRGGPAGNAATCN